MKLSNKIKQSFSLKENNLLDKAKLKSKMPKEWKFGDNTFARYKKLGIEISNKKIKVSGSIIR